MAILYHAGQRQTSLSYTPEMILDIRRRAIDRGFMNRNCYVLDPDGIFELAGLFTRYTGVHEPVSRVAADDEIEIIYYRYRSYGHFVAGVGGRVAYDPLGASHVVKKGRPRSKRIFKLV